MSAVIKHLIECNGVFLMDTVFGLVDKTPIFLIDEANELNTLRKHPVGQDALKSILMACYEYKRDKFPYLVI